MDKLANAFFKDRLMTSGPTPVPDFINSAMSKSVCYHRSPVFAEILGDCRKLLPPMFGTKQEALIFTGSGTLAMEGAIANFLNPGDEVICVNGGKFGQRWGEQAKIYGMKVHEVFVKRGEAVDPEEVRKVAKANPQVRAILVHSSETSTGARHNVKAVAQIAHELNDCLCMVDAITSLGVFDVPMDDWGVDVMVGGSQKGLMLPPGISFGVSSERAWARTQTVKNVRYYLDWRKEMKAIKENSGAFTSPVTLVGGLRESLQYFHRFGLKNVYSRNWRMTFATREAMKAMGFSLFVKKDSDCTAACTSIDAEGPYAKMLKEHYSLTISGGQDELKGKIVRIGHMGFIDGWDVLSSIMGVARCAEKMGKKIDIRAGVDTFWKVMDDERDYTPGV